MDFLIDLLINPGFDTSSPWSIFVFLVTRVGFIFIIFVILKYLTYLWLNWRQDLYYASLEWTYLAIDVPRDNEQSPKAVEMIFNQIWGSESGANFFEKWWQGKFVPNFSFEIVSIEGYIQYIIRTPTVFRDLVEAAVYAQYPEAQISEIEDYTKEFTPENFREKNYQMWGAQFKLVNDEVYPIKTYPLFEHAIAQTIVDPMAALLEIFSRLGRGEQAWLQILALPVRDETWKEKVENEVKKILGKEIKKNPSLVDKILEVPNTAATRLGDVVFGPLGSASENEKEEPWKMLAMSPGERGLVESLERKAQKIGFKVKIRYIYLGKDNKFSKPRGVSGLTGALRQFSLLGSNGFIPDKKTTTKVNYFRIDQRTFKLQKEILKNFKGRSQSRGTGGLGYILNTEELASIYHFPYIQTTTPSIKKAEAKRGEAPFALPVYEEQEKFDNNNNNNQVLGLEKKAAPPDDLPV